MIKTMLEKFMQFISRLILEMFLTWTGEIILYFVTIGKHKIRWDLYAEETPSRFVIFSEVSLWIGLAFWIVVIATIYKLLTKS